MKLLLELFYFLYNISRFIVWTFLKTTEGFWNIKKDTDTVIYELALMICEYIENIFHILKFFQNVQFDKFQWQNIFLIISQYWIIN